MVTAFLAGDTDKARKIHLDLIPVFDAMFVSTNPIPVKTAMNLMGHSVGGLRPPLIEATEKETAVIREVLKSFRKI